MKITKHQLRRIIKEERQKLVEMREMRFDLMYKPIYSTLEDMVMMNLPDDVEYLTEEEFARLEGVVAEALNELKDRVVDTRRFDR
jgi:Ser-tRNA(Ala) deacylase AlaX